MTDKNKIYKLLNHAEMDVDAYQSVDISQQEKDNLFDTLKNDIQPSKTRSNRKPWTLLAAAVIFVVLGSQTALGQQVQATAVSLIENIRYSLSEALGNEPTDTSHATLSFNQTASIGDAEISIEELVAFEHRMMFNLLIDLDKPVDEQSFTGFNDFSITINDEPVSTQSWTSYSEVLNKADNIHSVVYTIHLEGETPAEEALDVEIYSRDILYYNPSVLNETGQPLPPIEGQVHFSAETTLNELNQHTKIFEIQQTVNDNDYTFLIESFYVHPVTNFIEVSTEDENVLAEEFQLMEIRGTDENGKAVVFEQNNLIETEENRKYSFTLNEEQSGLKAVDLINAEELKLQFYLGDWPETGSGAIDLKPHGELFIIEMK